MRASVYGQLIIGDLCAGGKTIPTLIVTVYGIDVHTC